MELSFELIDKKDLEIIIPFIQELMGNQYSDEILIERFSEMFDQNYECRGIFYQGEMIGVFGLWFMTRHYAGRSCQPDHVFIKEEFRSMGIGKQLFSWIYAYAKKRGCEASELDSYVSNHPSHKFYLNEGYNILGYHFVKKGL
ncbi:GNAT family N-acetyltransferase [Aquimarina rhabdastrellae]